MKKLLLSLFVLVSLVSFSWSGHEALTYYLIQDLPNASTLVEITPYNYVEDRVYNQDFLVLEDVAGQRKFFEPLGDGVFPPDPTPMNNKLPVWQILTIYSPEPDNGMDEGLNLDPLQVLIGNSQGVRHMRYRIGILSAFQGDKSFLYFVNMSKIAFENGDRYWGYRFLARALHYIEDLSQPYHNAPGELGEMIWAAMNKNMSTILGNAHYFLDDYLVYLLYYSDNAARETILGAKPLFFDTYEEYVQSVMDYTLAKFPIVHREVKRIFGEDTLLQRIKIDDMKERDKDGEFAVLKSEILSILSYSSSVIKGFLLDFLKDVGEID
ncbi:phospholipase C/P1 nuclease family protein [Thermosipho atlanticus]|uniref:Zinc dependent phospholipase C n=1 Tax=Thermosipho atlanticus DSM 15807 TaxID=1123380 RepID=A0A1M5R2X1_9BACT|nr:hypothetical protein [Thermosipho atlanticus]SHH20488.1 hypothetical protein SAMN02745199_0297 [Thermosipho atlanticus DSM 15807]